MSVRINLLPEARMLRIKNEKTRRLVLLISVIVCGSILVINAILLLLLGARQIAIAKNNSDIAAIKKDLANKQTLEKEVTTFNQSLKTASQLVDRRIYLSYIFDETAKALPTGTKLTDFSLDATYKAKASVTAKDYDTVATYIAALQQYNVTFGSVPGLAKGPVFTDVKVTSVSQKDRNGEAKFDVTYQVSKDLVNKAKENVAAGNATPSPAGGSN